jgi:glutamate-1-semialdehyde 2,1-aminomutase
MDCLAPVGGVYQAGTLSGNPISVAAGLANLKMIQTESFQETINYIVQEITNIITTSAKRHNLPIICDSQGGMFGLFFANNLPINFEQVSQINKELYNKFFAIALRNGVFFPPSMFEACFVNIKHVNILSGFEQVMDEIFKVLIQSV